MPFTIQYNPEADKFVIEGNLSFVEVSSFKIALDAAVIRHSMSPDGAPNNWHALLLEQLASGHKIAAIKLWRTVSSNGLYNAKVFVENIMDRDGALPHGREYPNILPDDLEYHQKYYYRIRPSY